MRHFSILPLVTFCWCVSSVFVDEAYKVDFHKALLGLPRLDSTFFHQPYAESKASLLYTISQKNVIGAVNPKDGTLVWRQVLPSNESITDCILRAGQRADTVYSACGSTIGAWSSGDGRLVWDREFRHELIRDIQTLRPSSGHGDGSEDVVALLQGQSSKVELLSREDGRIKWTYESTRGDQVVKLSTSRDKIFVVSLHSALLKGPKITVTTLDAANGKALDHFQLGSDGEVSSVDDILFTQTCSQSPVLIWTDQGRSSVKVNILGTKPVLSINTESKGSNIERVAVHGPNHMDAPSHFLVHYETHDENWAVIFHVDTAKSKIIKAYDLPRQKTRSTFSATSTSSATYFMRISEDGVSLTSSASEGILERWQMAGFAVPGLLDTGFPVHATSEVALRSGTSYAVRSAVLLSSGDWVLVRNGESIWARSESLAGIVSAEWAELRAIDSVAANLKQEVEQSLIPAFVHRANRHLQTLQTLPVWVYSLFARLTHFALSLGEQERQKNLRVSDTNAFKLIIAATDNGRVIGLDFTHSGRVLFNLEVEEGESTQNKTTIRAALATLPMKSEASGDHNQWLHELDVPSGQEGMKLTMLGQYGLPKKEPSANLQSLYRVKDGHVVGFRDSVETWSFVPAAGERIELVASILQDEPVASIGKVLADRSVLYKYLNPNALVLISVNDLERTASLFVLDGVTGDVLHSSKFQRVDTARSVAAVISENWFAVSFASDQSEDTQSKGYQLVMSEMYESEFPNNRGVLGASSNYSTIRPNTKLTKPHVISKTYHVPEEISQMAVTQTRQGITSRQLLVSLLQSRSIVGIPGYVLDARRIFDKDPTTPQMQEGLSRYNPLIDMEPTWVLNHKQEVLGVKKIMTSPALFESTGLVFAYGLDVFGTQVAPSFAFDILGSTFNKFQLVVTVVALLAATFVVAPFIQRKETNLLWQNS